MACTLWAGSALFYIAYNYIYRATKPAFIILIELTAMCIFKMLSMGYPRLMGRSGRGGAEGRGRQEKVESVRLKYGINGS